MGKLALINREANILDKRINLLLLAGGVSSLKVIEDIKVLSRSEQIKENVVLRADTHKLTDFIHLLEEVDIIAAGIALRFFDQTSQH